ncbi:MAG: T9SS type A sorting domain-containing protein [Flavobacterium sp.]|nr:T9SS type A sorting domain-containing protein [Flavobacterium sp.]
MKKNKLLLIAMGIALTTQTLVAQVPSYVPTNGLVVYYPFSGNANEQLGNSNNGIINGATLTSDRNGNANCAYNFNGVNNFIDLPQNFYGGQSTSTISFGLRFKVDTNGDFFIWNKDGSWLEVGIYTRSNGKFGIFWAYPNQYNGIETNIGAISPNIWYDAVIIINGLNSKIYLNNIEQTGLTINIPSNMIGFGDDGTCGVGINRFGFKKTSCSPGEYFKGVLDEFYMYDRILTQQEITNLYNSVEVPTYSDTCNNVSGSLTQGLVGYWPFCGNANDDSGNGNNGVVNGATLTTDRFGNANSAYNYDGNNYITIPSLNQNNDWSISFWFNSLNQSNFGLQYPLGLGCSSISTFSTPGFGINGGVQQSPCNALLLNKMLLTDAATECTSNIWTSSTFQQQAWYNVVINKTGNTYTIFINGQNSASGNLSDINLDNITLGSRCNYNWLKFVGKIDDLGVWNRALTPNEVTQLYNQNQCITNITVTDTLVINVGQLSFTNPVAYANNITISPNPASTQINISFNNITNLTGGSIKVINSLGQQVATAPITATGTQTNMQLNTWGGSGLYFVQILNAQGQILDIKKIILQ